MGANLELFEQHYKATVGFDGVYIGRVIGAEGKRRKKFLVESVVAPALPLELNGARRRGYRSGEVIELPDHAIKPTDVKGTDYVTAVRNQVSECQKKSDALAKAYLQVLNELQAGEFFNS